MKKKKSRYTSIISTKSKKKKFYKIKTSILKKNKKKLNYCRKNNKFINKEGYVCYKDHKGYFHFIHIEKIEKFIKRKKKKCEHVHHINKNRSDNRLQNLLITKKSFHLKFHSNERKGLAYCLKCGRSGHYYNNCSYETNVNGQKIVWENKHLTQSDV